jgi:hypothetical protein
MCVKHYFFATLLVCGSLFECTSASAQTVIVLSGGTASSAAAGSGQTVVLAQQRPFLAWLRPRARRAGIFAIGALRFYAGIYNIPLPPAQNPNPGNGAPPTDGLPDPNAAAAAAADAEAESRLNAIDRYLGIDTKTPAAAAVAAQATQQAQAARQARAVQQGRATIARPAAPKIVAASPSRPARERTLDGDISASLNKHMASAFILALENPDVQKRIREIANGSQSGKDPNSGSNQIIPDPITTPDPKRNPDPATNPNPTVLPDPNAKGQAQNGANSAAQGVAKPAASPTGTSAIKK